MSDNMQLAVFAYSRTGCETARRVMECLKMSGTGSEPSDGSGAVKGSEAAGASGTFMEAYTVSRLAGDGFLPIPQPSPDFYGRLFSEKDALIFIGAAGIAVRAIAPHVRDKRTDPAVICMDELGTYVIPLLSGHLGGANALASALADMLGAQAVITTATDIHSRFSADTWAARQGLVIDDMKIAKAVSAAVLEGEVPISGDFPIEGKLPAGLREAGAEDLSAPLGIRISYKTIRPFEKTLLLIPRILHLGIGCRRGVSAEAIRHAVETVLEQEQIDVRAITCAASIDLKADETGLLSYCEEMGWPVGFYSAEQLNEVEGIFSSSAFVSGVTGVDCVCERAAMIGADTLIVRKTAVEGVTVALAAQRVELAF